MCMNIKIILYFNLIRSLLALGLLASTFPDSAQRGRAISVAFGGVAIGIMAGPVIGGFLYRAGGIVLPFGVLACIALLEGGECEL